MNLEEDERIDDLEYKGLKIIQNKRGFCFGIDSILLSDFAKEIKKDTQVLDLGTGTGILSILLSEKTNLKKIYGIEVQEKVAKMAERSVKLNLLENKVEIINDNIINIEKYFEKNSFDVIITNPPYKKENTGIKNDNELKLISRHEVKAKLEDFIKISFNMLKENGEFYMVHRPDRMVDIFYELRKNKLEPKKVKMVYSTKEKEPCLILIKAVKNAKPFLKIEKPFFIYDEKGNYTQEILKIYNK